MYKQDNARAFNDSLCVFTYARFRATFIKTESSDSLQEKGLQELHRFRDRKNEGEGDTK